ncbi:hypothetical protein E2562_013065 [Oryza meyeriana var. granulata]|uniref:NAC domain-containing protein n=1 Tax=Oryza meyeriana var. granulata TaxID=110450 RepID=A0A6G1DKC2_9ORYZ|nr:hypothetical protein E2562_013065 [Oryza meyeriana var. granulata]
MAEGEEKKGAFGGGNKEEEDEFPLEFRTFRFKPEDKELVEYHLLPRLQGRSTVPNDNIIETNVYKFHPDKLIELYKDRGEEAWYLLSPRTRKYQGGDRPSRSTEDDHGRWKASTGRKEAEEAIGGGDVKFCKNSLAYHEGPVKEERQTKCLMHEFTIPDSAAFNEELSSSQEPGSQASASTAAFDGKPSSSQPGPVGTSEETAGAKQRGNKRPAEEHAAVAQRPPQQPKLTPGGAPEQASLYIGGTGAGGVQMPLRTAIHDHRTGHTMAHVAGHATMPRQHMSYYGSMPIPHPQVAYT